ncbi:MAG: hypothetical protein QOC58_1966 [Mycobacterium sp.]|jgi:hypothetical protein|nr:hypothetical protein [Mycobacterium sp.]
MTSVGGPGPIEVQNLDTVLGLSVTPAAVGWVLVEGHGADGTILDHRELALLAGRGVRAVSTAEQVVDEVLRVEAQATQSDHHVRVVGVTWNDEAAAQAALVLEALTDAGMENIVPVRFLDSVDTLARAIAPVIGYEQTAVCILERDASTVVMVDVRDGETQTAVKHVRGGFDGLTHWLTGMFERHGWRPGGVVVVGADSDVNGLSWQLEKALAVPVFAQTMAQVTVARGAALAAAQSTDFTDEHLVPHRSEPVAAPARPGKWSYAGAMTALAAGAITFVGSLSMAVGIELAPSGAPSTPKHAVHAITPDVAEAVASAVAPPPESAARTAPDGEQAERQLDGESAVRQPDPAGRQPYLTRVLEHIPGDAGDAADDAGPQAPAQP